MGGTLVPAIAISPPSHPPLLRPIISLRGRHSSTTAVQSQRNNDEARRHSRWNSSMYYWDRFYHRHQNKFFKNRHYLEKDWGHYFSADDEDDAHRKVVFEVGCGTGSTIFPLVTKYPKLFVHACDFSPHAITLIKSHTKFCEDTINAFVCNVAEENVCEFITPSSVDVVTLVFMLSAVSPEMMPSVIHNLKEVLKPKGFILLRDYATGDFAQAVDTSCFQPSLTLPMQVLEHRSFYMNKALTLPVWVLEDRSFVYGIKLQICPCGFWKIEVWCSDRALTLPVWIWARVIPDLHGDNWMARPFQIWSKRLAISSTLLQQLFTVLLILQTQILNSETRDLFETLTHRDHKVASSVINGFHWR